MKGGRPLKINLWLHVIDAIGNRIGKISSFLMIFIISFMVISAFFRYLLHDAIPYLTAVPNIFFVYVCLGAAYAYNQRSFVIVDIFYRKLSVRWQAALDLITSVFFFFFMLVLLQTSTRFASPALAKFKFDPIILIDFNRWPTTIIFPIGPLLLLIAGTVRFIRNIIVLITGQEMASEKEKEGAKGERV